MLSFQWTVGGKWKLGIFALTDLHPDVEITIDYQLENFGRKVQTCFCQSANCRGSIGSADTEDTSHDNSETSKQDKVSN